MFSDGPRGIINTNEQNLSEIDYRLNNTWYSYYRINIYILYFRFHGSAKNSIKLYIFIIDVIEPNLYRTYKCSFWTSIWYNSVQSDSSIFSNHFPDFNHLVFELVWSFISQILSLEILVVVEYPSARFTAISRRLRYPSWSDFKMSPYLVNHTV